MKTRTMTLDRDQNKIARTLGFAVLAAILATALAAAPSFARMGGGSGGGSGGGMGGSGGGMGGSGSAGGSGTMGADRPGTRMEERERDYRHVDVGEMPAIRTGGLGSGDMTLEIRPVKYSDGRLEMRYFANTHSVSLGEYDLMELSRLEAGGEVYRPVSADPMRGHHANGRIVFEVPEKPETFRIVIRDIPRVEERLYDWK